AGRSIERGALYTFSIETGTHVRRENSFGDAEEIWRAHRTENLICSAFPSPFGRGRKLMATEADNKSHVSPPCILVIFGAAGDLTKRKLVPALYNLRKDNLLPENFAIIGVARAEMKDEEFRHRLRDDMNEFATEKSEPEV